MSDTLRQVVELVKRGEVKISDHGYDELAADDLFADVVVAGVYNAVVVEDYPDYPKGSCVLVRQLDDRDRYIHVLWGVPRGHTSPATLITAYRPASDRWSADAMTRTRREDRDD